MVTVSDLKQKADMPYQLPLKVKVIRFGDKKKYTFGDQEREFRSIVIGDKTGVIRLNLYDLQRENLLKEGKFVILKGYILKSELRSKKKYLVATAITKIFTTMEIDYHYDGIEQEADLLLNPQPADDVTLLKAKTSPTKTLVSVRGQIIVDEMPVTRSKNNEDLQVRTISLKDDTCTVKVALWREKASTQVVSGDFVHITNCIVTEYPKNEMSLSTTSRSTIKKAEMPLEQKQFIIEGVELNDDNISLCISMNGEFQDEMVTVPKQLVEEHYGKDVEIHTLLPLQVTAMLRGTQLVNFI